MLAMTAQSEIKNTFDGYKNIPSNTESTSLMKQIKQMTKARIIALEVLPHFSRNVLAQHVLTYGFYADAIGREQAKESMIIGQAMHAIGAACVFAKIPVAPLYFLKRQDNKGAEVFLNDPLENQRISEHFSTLFVSAREYSYTEEDFQRIEKTLREKIPANWSPHFMWHVAIVKKPKGSDATYFERALFTYKDIIENERQARNKNSI